MKLNYKLYQNGRSQVSDSPLQSQRSLQAEPQRRHGVLPRHLTVRVQVGRQHQHGRSLQRRQRLSEPPRRPHERQVVCVPRELSWTEP